MDNPIPMDRIIVPDIQPRQDETIGIEELAKNIDKHNLLQPIIVRPVGNKFEIIAGKRRWLAHQILKWTHIRATIRQATDDEAWEIAITENLMREDLHPYYEASAIAELYNRVGSMEQTAEKLSKPVHYILQAIKLGELCGDAKIVFLENHINLATARLLCNFDAKKQIEILNGIKHYSLENDYGSFKHAQEWVASNMVISLEDVSFDLADKKLYPKAGPCTTCPKNTGANKLLFEALEHGSRCTDGKCFNRKMSAFMDRKFKELEKETPGKVVRIDERYGEEKKGVLSQHKYEYLSGDGDQYTGVKNKGRDCDHTKQGLVVGSHKSGKLGRVWRVCVGGDGCKVHGYNLAVRARGEDIPENETPAEQFGRRMIKRYNREKIKDCADVRALMTIKLAEIDPAAKDAMFIFNDTDLKIIAKLLATNLHISDLNEKHLKDRWPTETQWGKKLSALAFPDLIRFIRELVATDREHAQQVPTLDKRDDLMELAFSHSMDPQKEYRTLQNGRAKKRKADKIKHKALLERESEALKGKSKPKNEKGKKKTAS